MPKPIMVMMADQHDRDDHVASRRTNNRGGTPGADTPFRWNHLNGCTEARGSDTRPISQLRKVLLMKTSASKSTPNGWLILRQAPEALNRPGEDGTRPYLRLRVAARRQVIFLPSVQPPSTVSTAPVVKELSSLARNIMALATSWVSPDRPMAWSSWIFRATSASWK